MEKSCSYCKKTKSIEEFYESKYGEGKIKFSSRCKKCHNIDNYEKRPTGINKIDKETVNKVKEIISKNPDIKIKKIGDIMNMKYSKIYRIVTLLKMHHQVPI